MSLKTLLNLLAMAQQQVTMKKIVPEKKHRYYTGTDLNGQCGNFHCANQMKYEESLDDSIYGDISTYSNDGIFCNSRHHEKFWKRDERSYKKTKSLPLPADSRHSWSEPSIDAPAPMHYQLKDKRQRHVYHTITLSQLKSTPSLDIDPPRLERNVINPPAIPYKPHYLRTEYSDRSLPMIPPKVKNNEAVIQRQQLTEEYFENILRNVDDSSSSSSDCSHVVSSNNVTSPQWPQTDPGCSSSCDNELNNPPTCQPTLPSNSTDNNAANVVTRTQDLTYSLKLLKLCGWYWGDMNWKDAELMLQQKPGEIGLFLLRDSQDPLHILTVTVRTDIDTIRHIRVEYTNGKFQLYDPSRGTSRGAANCVRHSNIVTFIKLAMKHSRNGNFLYFVRPKSMGEAPIQIQLLSPISRFACVKSLKYCSRFVIRNQVPQEEVRLLPVPHQLQRYLIKPYYFDLDEDLQCASRA